MILFKNYRNSIIFYHWTDASVNIALVKTSQISILILCIYLLSMNATQNWFDVTKQQQQKLSAIKIKRNCVTFQLNNVNDFSFSPSIVWLSFCRVQFLHHFSLVNNHWQTIHLGQVTRIINSFSDGKNAIPIACWFHNLLNTLQISLYYRMHNTLNTRQPHPIPMPSILK